MPQAGRSVLIAGFSFLLLMVSGKCRKTPTQADGNPPALPAISISLNPSSGGTETNVSVSILVSANTKEISVFGVDLSFESSMFVFQSVSKGTLTGGWAAVDGNEIKAGLLKIGGFRGSGPAIPVHSAGTLAVIKFKVTEGGQAVGRQSQLCIKDYSDDISGIGPEPACAVFTFQAQSR